MEYKILAYIKHFDCFQCKDNNGNIEYLDLFSDASFLHCPDFDNIELDERKQFCESLVGKYIKVEETFPWISFAQNIELIKK